MFQSFIPKKPAPPKPQPAPLDLSNLSRHDGAAGREAYKRALASGKVKPRPGKRALAIGRRFLAP